MPSTAAKESKKPRTCFNFTPDVRADLAFLVEAAEQAKNGEFIGQTRYLSDVIRGLAADIRSNGHRKRPPPAGRWKRSA